MITIQKISMTILLEGQHAKGGNVLRTTFPISKWPIRISVCPPGTVGHPCGQGYVPHLPSSGDSINGFPLGDNHLFDLTVHKTTTTLVRNTFHIQIRSIHVRTRVPSQLNERWTDFSPTEDIELFTKNGWKLSY